MQKIKSQSKQKREPSMRYSQNHVHVEECCRKQKETRNKRHSARRTRQSSSKFAHRNVKEVINSISDVLNSPSNSNANSVFCSSKNVISRHESENSVIYIGTTYISNMPRKDSIIDLTKSDTTVLTNWPSNYNLDNYDISGDNVVDELHLKDNVSSAASIFTILPPQSTTLFATPSDELCICQSVNSSCPLSVKRNRSTSDVSSQLKSHKTKRVASSRCRLAEKNDVDSSDCVWKLKRTHPLTSGLCANNSEKFACMDLSNSDILQIVDDLENEYKFSNSQHSGLSDELRALNVASSLDSNMSNA